MSIWLLTPCARTLGDAAHIPDGCERYVYGSPIGDLAELADALANPPTYLACRPCQDADPPF